MHHLSAECLDDGVNCDGHDYTADETCNCSCHGENAPFFATNDDVRAYHQ